MKTIKIIDLLNKSANGEKMPKRIIFQGYEYEYEDYRNDYAVVNNGINKELKSSYLFYGIFQKNDSYLNHTVQIIEEILDTKEKEYLSNVIRPFRNRIEYIKKNTLLGGKKETIVINYTDIFHPNEIYFPSFEKGTMYKNMKPNKEYSFEELGI